MAIRKNKKRIDPRYFLHETTYRDEIEEQGSFSVSGPDPKDALSTDDLFKLMKAGYSADDLRGVNNTNLTPEMVSVLGRGNTPRHAGVTAPGGPGGQTVHAKGSTERDYRYDDDPYDEGY